MEEQLLSAGRGGRAPGGGHGSAALASRGRSSFGMSAIAIRAGTMDGSSALPALALSSRHGREVTGDMAMGVGRRSPRPAAELAGGADMGMGGHFPWPTARSSFSAAAQCSLAMDPA
ncbi:unnamed protein product [Urochloa humidicola]